MSSPRGVLPDGVDDTRVVLIKACAYLRLTYEIRLATTMAEQQRRTLVLACKKACRFSPDLERHLKQSTGVVQVLRS